MIKKNKKIFLAGHNGLLGSSILRTLKKKNYNNIITASKKNLDLRNQNNVNDFIKSHKPEVIIIAAAKVGGIYANNTFRAEFIYDNLQIQNNLIHSAFLNNIKDLIFFGSSCIYPRNCKQPIKESYLLQGKLENTNESYAIAKIAGIKLCESYNFQYGTNFKCLMPTNTFGPNDNYDLKTSHFYPALIKKFFISKFSSNKIVRVWGTGKAKRELIFVDDIADACIFFMNKKTKHNLINIGTGKDFTISYYANFLKKIIYNDAKLLFEKKGLDGTPRKLLNVNLAKSYGWKAKTSLQKATGITIREYLKSIKT